MTLIQILYTLISLSAFGMFGYQMSSVLILIFTNFKNRKYEILGRLLFCIFLFFIGNIFFALIVKKDHNYSKKASYYRDKAFYYNHKNDSLFYLYLDSAQIYNDSDYYAKLQADSIKLFK